ncbi:hypothetical protein V8E51_020023 [Hyaloscypha variabilis]
MAGYYTMAVWDVTAQEKRCIERMLLGWSFRDNQPITTIYVATPADLIGLSQSWIQAEALLNSVIRLAAARRAGSWNRLDEEDVMKAAVEGGLIALCGFNTDGNSMNLAKRLSKEVAIQDMLRGIKNVMDRALLHVDDFDKLSVGDEDVRHILQVVHDGVNAKLLQSQKCQLRLRTRMLTEAAEGHHVMTAEDFEDDEAAMTYPPWIDDSDPAAEPAAGAPHTNSNNNGSHGGVGATGSDVRPRSVLSNYTEYYYGPQLARMYDEEVESRKSGVIDWDKDEKASIWVQEVADAKAADVKAVDATEWAAVAKNAAEWVAVLEAVIATGTTESITATADAKAATAKLPAATEWAAAAKDAAEWVATAEAAAATLDTAKAASEAADVKAADAKAAVAKLTARTGWSTAAAKEAAEWSAAAQAAAAKAALDKVTNEWAAATETAAAKVAAAKAASVKAAAAEAAAEEATNAEIAAVVTELSDIAGGGVHVSREE